MKEHKSHRKGLSLFPEIHRPKQSEILSPQSNSLSSTTKVQNPMECSNRCLATIRNVFKKMAEEVNKCSSKLDKDWEIQTWKYSSLTVPILTPRTKNQPILKEPPVPLTNEPVESSQFRLKERYIPQTPKVRYFLQTKRLKSPIQTVQDLSKAQKEQLRAYLYQKFLATIQSNNGAVPIPCPVYKVYIGKGNNHRLVQRLFKNRWWWTPTESYKNAHFVWTQGKHKITLNCIAENPLEFSHERQIPSIKHPKMSLRLLNSQEKEYGITGLKAKPISVLSKFLSSSCVLHNRLPKNSQLCSKKHLFSNMSRYYSKQNKNVFDYIPLTFHITSSSTLDVLNHKKGDYWIIKPGEKTNQGRGITVSNKVHEIQERLDNLTHSTLIVQKYIKNSLLINKRKFDIRCYGLITCFENRLNGYFYKDGYIRTASKEFNLKDTSDVFIHLTNDAVQKKCEDYGRHEQSNKMSYTDFNKYIKKHFSGVNFFDDILPQIQERVTESFEAVHDRINPSMVNSFEVFGYDFMVDENFKVWLIEVNTNPCLELSSSYLAALIPNVIDSAFKIALDAVFPAPSDHKKYDNWVQESNLHNDFVLVHSFP